MLTPPKPSRPLLRQIGRAIADFGMIRPQDRILVAVSGGKDSLSLLHALLSLRMRSPVPFELAAATVDPGIEGFDPSPLKAYIPSLGISHFYERQEIAARAKRNMRGQSFCAYCARMRRGILYACARRHGYNVLALGQHLDDLAESLLMSAFFNGQLRTMKAHYRNDDGDLRIIRPLVYVRERQTAAFAANAGLPVIPDNCPACFRAPAQRQAVKRLLSDQERQHPRLFASLRQAMMPDVDDKGPRGGVIDGETAYDLATSLDH